MNVERRPWPALYSPYSTACRNSSRIFSTSDGNPIRVLLEMPGTSKAAHFK